MLDGQITSGYDIAELAVDAFTIFFVLLIFYLRKEDRREGYPLEADTTGKLEEHGIWMPKPKLFSLSDGRIIHKPDGEREKRSFAMKRLAVWPGAPFAPTGNPMEDGVGPASYALREEVPDKTLHGHNKIAPMSALEGFFVVENDPDPRGADVIAADGKKAGTVSDLWIDRGEAMIRYYEVALESGKKVLLPAPFANVTGRPARISVNAILASQFEKVPGVKAAGEVTRREEDQICAYYAGGMLYATPDRAEPWL